MRRGEGGGGLWLYEYFLLRTCKITAETEAEAKTCRKEKSSHLFTLCNTITNYFFQVGAYMHARTTAIHHNSDRAKPLVQANRLHLPNPSDSITKPVVTRRHMTWRRPKSRTRHADANDSFCEKRAACTTSQFSSLAVRFE